MSPRIRAKYREEDLRMYISGISNPHHAAFEIGAGVPVAVGRFAFNVRMYEHYTGEKWKAKRGRMVRLVLIKIGPEDWRVEELPGGLPPASRTP